jgi:hypothetical protein
MKSLFHSIQVCDAISGARPGARRQVFRFLHSTFKDLEDIALVLLV